MFLNMPCSKIAAALKEKGYVIYLSPNRVKTPTVNKSSSLAFPAHLSSAANSTTQAGRLHYA